MKIKILYEDKDILVIDKPSGISVHPDGKTKEKTITDWVLKNYPKTEDVGEPIVTKDNPSFNSSNEGLSFVIKRPGIVHRLDKETSGVLIIVKTKKAFAYFKEQFMNREIKKVYNAIVSGWVKNDRGVINKSIGRSPNDFRKRLAGRGARGELREAITEYKVLKRFTSPVSKIFSSCALPRVRGGTLGDKKFQKPELCKFTYLEVRPKTGRTHQIRVHMKYLNHPIACDSLYGAGNPCPKSIKRLALHAKSIEFKNPKGKIIKVESPLPKEIEKIVK